MRFSISLAIGLALVCAHQIQAQKSKSAGWFFGAGLEGTSIKVAESTATESGGGLGLVLGYGFNKRWSLYGQLSGATIDSESGGNYVLGHFDLGARVHFRTGPNVVVPFFQFGLAGRGVSQEVLGSTVTGNGGGVSLGGGLNAHFTPRVAFSGAITWTVGSFDEYAINGGVIPSQTVNATSARVHLGLVWSP